MWAETLVIYARSRPEALDFMLDYVDDAVARGDAASVENWLAEPLPRDATLIVALLIATLPWQILHTPVREEFKQRCTYLLTEMCGPSRARELLRTR